MNSLRSETLVIVERENGLAIELREVVKCGDRAFLIFARSDGSEAQVEIDPANLRAVPDGRIEAESSIAAVQSKPRNRTLVDQLSERFAFDRGCVKTQNHAWRCEVASRGRQYVEQSTIRLR